MNMEIREILPWDESHFYRMVRKFYQMSVVDHQIPDSHAKRTFELLMSGTPYARCFIAADDNNIPRGYCLCSITWSNEAGGLCVWIDELMVEEDLRGQGIGQMLIANVGETYPKAARFRLEVTDDNVRATSLYKSLGFKPLAYNQMVLDQPQP